MMKIEKLKIFLKTDLISLINKMTLLLVHKMKVKILKELLLLLRKEEKLKLNNKLLSKVSYYYYHFCLD
jgi:hypothetical protein